MVFIYPQLPNIPCCFRDWFSYINSIKTKNAEEAYYIDLKLEAWRISLKSLLMFTTFSFWVCREDYRGRSGADLYKGAINMKSSYNWALDRTCWGFGSIPTVGFLNDWCHFNLGVSSLILAQELLTWHSNFLLYLKFK